MTHPNLTHHGGATGVTGSCHRLQLAADRALLVDCGLFQGKDAEPSTRPVGASPAHERAAGAAEVGEASNAGSRARHAPTGGSANAHFEQHRVTFPVDDVLALIVTHVHIDHIGRLPYLLAVGYQGPILCSVPSARLLPLVIEDALKVGFTRDRKLIERFLEEVHSRLVPLEYETWHTLIDDARHHVRIRLQRAGHILGSAYVEVDMQTPEVPPSLRGAVGQPPSSLRGGAGDAAVQPPPGLPRASGPRNDASPSLRGAAGQPPRHCEEPQATWQSTRRLDRHVPPCCARG